MSWRFGFVWQPPVVVGDLAEALRLSMTDLIAEGSPSFGSIPARPPATDAGPLTADVAGLSGTYRWDIHHEAPVTSAAELAQRELTAYTVHFSRARAVGEAVLRAAQGPPRPTTGRRCYGPFFVDDADGDPFVLEWYAQEPDWAVPAIDPDARARAVRALAAGIRAATTPAALETALTSQPADAGIHAGEGRIVFTPPIAARQLAAALGAPDAIARTST